MDGGSVSAESVLPLEELEAQITELAGHLNAAQYRWLMLIAEFDRREGWAGAGIASCAHWLNFKCGLNIGAAREKVRVAHALHALPRIAASMAAGTLSYSKVRALTRVACPATEENLLEATSKGWSGRRNVDGHVLKFGLLIQRVRIPPGQSVDPQTGSEPCSGAGNCCADA